MQFSQTKIPDVYVVHLEPHRDERGFFARTFCSDEFRRHDIPFEPVQMNISFNKAAGTLRGMHYQAEPFGEPKLVRCTRGRLFDVAVDLRPSSPTFRQWIGVELAPDSMTMLYVPRGCAHGFLTLRDETEVSYVMGAAFSPGSARGVRWNDPAFAIEWPCKPIVISDRDLSYPDFQCATDRVDVAGARE
jgi:dTDP-4-dehydrorhamnose 3,5-epimerase